ncbi:hypothetical protein HC928_02245 [bacterium]|nr:hypothetical protein [bacterium]
MTTETTVRRGAQGKYDEETIKTAMEIVSKGGTLREASDATGMTQQAVQYHKRRYNIVGPRDTTQNKAADPLENQTKGLLDSYDREITRSEEIILAMQEKISDMLARRNRLAEAIGLEERHLDL